MNSSYSDERGNIINYYEIFNIPYNANKEEIRSAFCNLVKIYHPDISHKHTEIEKKKINFIIKGYKILIDDRLRDDYNRHLLELNKINEEGYVYLSKKRIKYSFSLKDLLLNRLLNKRMKRKDWIFNIGQDVEIFITPDEARRGAIAYVELPSRMQCPLCYGGDSYCHVCYGVGRITSTSNLEVKIPPHTYNTTMIDIDLINIKPDIFTSFTMKNLRIKITITHQKN
jgi:DnaJ-class molecular chaperone